MLNAFHPEDDSPAELAERLRVHILHFTVDGDGVDDLLPWSSFFEDGETVHRWRKDFDTDTIIIMCFEDSDDVEVELRANDGVVGPSGVLVIEVPATNYSGGIAAADSPIAVTGEKNVEDVAKSSSLVMCLVGLEAFGIPITDALRQIVHENGETAGITPHTARTLLTAIRLKQL